MDNKAVKPMKNADPTEQEQREKMKEKTHLFV